TNTAVTAATTAAFTENAAPKPPTSATLPRIGGPTSNPRSPKVRNAPSATPLSAAGTASAANAAGAGPATDVARAITAAPARNPEIVSARASTTRPAVRPNVAGDRKSTRLNSSHVKSSYAVFCMKKNNN